LESGTVADSTGYLHENAKYWEAIPVGKPTTLPAAGN
jgi:hypothetical protein